jgi:hypothetical protein
VGFYGFFVEKSHKNPDYWAALAVCRVKNRLFRRFFVVSGAMRNKLLEFVHNVSWTDTI